MAAATTPTKNDPKRLSGLVELTTSWQILYTATAGERGTRLLSLLASNITNFGAMLDFAHVVGAGVPGFLNLLGSGIAVPASGYPMNIPFNGLLMTAGDTFQARCQNMKANPGSSVLVGTAEETYTASNATYTATVCTYVTALSAAIVSSPANADLVGRRIWAGANSPLTPRTGTFGIITANDITAKTITCAAGWRERVGNKEVTAATPAANTNFTISASLRDTSETATFANQFLNGKMTAGAAGASSGRVIGNSAGIATYGTTYQIDVGGWAGGTPAVSNPFQVASGIAVVLSGIEMAT